MEYVRMLHILRSKAVSHESSELPLIANRPVFEGLDQSEVW